MEAEAETVEAAVKSSASSYLVITKESIVLFWAAASKGLIRVFPPPLFDPFQFGGWDSYWYLNCRMEAEVGAEAEKAA